MKTLNRTRTLFAVHVLLLLFNCYAEAQTRQRRPPQGGRIAIVVDERLSALRATPDLSGRLLQRISRGRLVAILARRLTSDGILFYRVRVTRRTQGWLQKEALVSASVPGDDRTLLSLVQTSQEFDRLARAKIFLDTFPHSPLRPQVLLLYGETAEISAARLSREAARRLDLPQASAGAPESSYFLNYSGLDRYNRQGVRLSLIAARGSFTMMAGPGAKSSHAIHGVRRRSRQENSSTL